MADEPLGTIPDGQEATGFYEIEDGVPVFETRDPYLMKDGHSLQPPLPVKLVTGPIFIDSMGNAQSASPIKRMAAPSVNKST